MSTAEIEKTLSGLMFPANKQALIKQAKERKLNNDLVNMLNGLPDKEYMDASEVSSELGVEFEEE